MFVCLCSAFKNLCLNSGWKIYALQNLHSSLSRFFSGHDFHWKFLEFFTAQRDKNGENIFTSFFLAPQTKFHDKIKFNKENGKKVPENENFHSNKIPVKIEIVLELFPSTIAPVTFTLLTSPAIRLLSFVYEKRESQIHLFNDFNSEFVCVPRH